MKIETKRKILWWVKRVLRYAEYADCRPHTVVETKKIVKVRSEYKYSSNEIMMIDKRHVVTMQLIDELVKNNMIKYSNISKNGDTLVTATLNVLVP